MTLVQQPDIAGAGNTEFDDFSLDIPPGEGSYTEPIILSMLTNTEFLDFYINRWADLLNTRLLAENTGPKLDVIRNRMQSVINEQHERWFSPEPEEAWLSLMNDQKEWMAERVPVVWSELENYYSLNKVNINLDVSNAAHGSIQCNTIPAAEITAFPWSGDYFEEVTIRLKAINKAGFQFVEWTGDVSSTDMEISVSPAEGMNIVAVFEPRAQSVTLNELLASNSNSTADAAGEFDDWIELYNTTSLSVDLSGYFLSDDAMDLQKWAFPEGTSIGPNGYLIVWADEDANQSGLHCSFKLSKDGESVFFSDAENNLLDETTFTEQNSDISWGRFENGIGPFVQMNPTFNGENSELVNTLSRSESELIVFPNPARDFVTVSNPLHQLGHVRVYDVIGVLLYEAFTSADSGRIDVSSWPAGVNFVNVDKRVVKLFIL